MKRKKFFITTAIDYTNDIVHVGHAYQKILADAIARYHREKGDGVHFLTGTDEHGQKVAKSAKKKDLSPKEYVDKIAAADKDEWDCLNISYDRFIRTTDPDHKKLVKKFWQKVKANGDIYLDEYQGLYCEGCEAFMEETDLVDGRCPFHQQQKPIQLKEKNYFFRLSKYQPFLEKQLKIKGFVFPESKRKEALSFVERGLKDFSISRHLDWGIPVPDDPKQTIYVWFDALLNYLTYGEQKKCWPADIHVLGKDNLRFHAIYWPAMLKSAEYPLPKTIIAHDFLSLNGKKVSKSLGNIIQPSELVKQFGVDAIRYYFLRFGPLQNDVDISTNKIKEVYNADLANGLGNVVARIAKLAENHNLEFESDYTKTSLSTDVGQAIEKHDINNALKLIWQALSRIDNYINQERPWESASKAKKTLEQLITKGEAINTIREIACLLRPFLPQTAAKIEEQFKGPKVKAQKPLFPRLT